MQQQNYGNKLHFYVEFFEVSVNVEQIPTETHLCVFDLVIVEMLYCLCRLRPTSLCRLHWENPGISKTL